MKQYYIYNGTEQLGPFSFEVLKQRNITANTLIWYEGLTDWCKAGEIAELKTLITSFPPPLPSSTPLPPTPHSEDDYKNTLNINKYQSEPNHKGNWIKYAVIGILLLVTISFFVAYQNDKANKQYELEMRIAEQEKIARELKIKEISEELASSYKTLNEAKRQLNDANSFKLLRTRGERHKEITEAEEIVKSWEEHISKLESELRLLQRN